MTQQSLSTNQPRFSIRTYSLGATSVLLAYACLAAGPVASANTTTSPATSPTTVQTTSSTTEQKNNQVSQSSTNQTNTTPATKSNTEQISQEKNVTDTAASAIQPIQITTPSTSPVSQTRSQQTIPSTQQNQNQTRQTSTNQSQTNTSSASSSAISQKNTTQTQTNSSPNRTTTQARTASIQPANTQSSTTGSIALGDDYPYKVGWQVDPWGLYTRQCTSFVAYRLSTVNGFTLPRAYGNADVWGTRARSEGYRVDMNPALGAVAWWNSMHVAWVTAIDGDRVEIEEYNYNYSESYHRRWISKNSVSGYIHFKDLTNPSVTQTGSNTSATSDLASSGTYTFTQQAPIKNEAKQSSSTLDYYYAGESVRYDRVLTADGYQWISYLSYSGQRRYIPIKEIHSNSTSTTVDKSQGKINITNINQTNGSFDVIISNVKSPKTIKTVFIPIWSDKDGQDDIIWYPAQRQSDGSYKVTVQASKHKGDRGLYHIHVYYTDSSNQLEFIAGTTTQLTAISQQTNQTNSNLPASGTYYFKSRASVRNQPSLSAAEITYYNAGSIVRYDKVVIAEGRQWISYVSYSGARRYIAIP